MISHLILILHDVRASLKSWMSVQELLERFPINLCSEIPEKAIIWEVWDLNLKILGRLICIDSAVESLKVSMNKLVFVRMVKRLTLLALVAMLIAACFSEMWSDCFKVSEDRVFSRKLLVFKSKFTSPGFSRTVYNNRRPGAPATRDSVGVMFHNVPSTPNPIQNKYPRYRHH